MRCGQFFSIQSLSHKVRGPICLALAVLGCTLPFVISAQDDQCVEDGGTAYCVGPEVGPWSYQVSDGYNGGQGPTEAIAIERYKQNYRNNIELGNATACEISLTDIAPAWQPIGIGHGNAMEGDYASALYYATGQFWAVNWTLSTETGAERIPLRVIAPFTPFNAPACSSQYGPHGAYVNRGREVSCPSWPIYAPNWSSPANAYCYRSPAQPDKQKNLGPPCGDCRKPAPGPLFGNPVNVTSGNKYQVEQDYVGRHLQFSRHYNSQLWTGPYPPNSSLGYSSRLGVNWRSTYDRHIRFNDSLRFPTAYAYRPDGKTLYFKLANGVFHPDADISDRLVRLFDGSGNPIGWEYTMAGSQDKESYDEAGTLTAIRNREGVVQTLSYDPGGRLQAVTDSFGHTLTFGYDASNRLATFTVPGGQSYSYGYNAVGNVSSVTYPNGTTRTYVYNEPEHTGGPEAPYLLTGIVDETNGRFSTYKYAYGDLALSTEHVGGVQLYQFTYPGTQILDQASVTDPLLQLRTYTFSRMHGVARIASISEECGSGCVRQQTFTYDANANVSSRTDFNGNITNYGYDLARNLETSRIEAQGTSRERTITTQWHATYRLPTQIDEPGKRTIFTHDASGNVLTRTELDTATSTSRTWTYTYNSYGKILTANGPRTDVSDVTTYTYYSCSTGFQCGQVHTITNAAGHVTTYNTYNAHGQPLTITDPNGVVTTLTYDLRQRLTSRTVGTEATTFEYWPTGLLKKATLPDASYLAYTYDAAHRLTEIQDSEGNRVVYTLDAMGNRTQEELFDPSSVLTQTRSRVFDTLNRLQKEIGAAGTAGVTTTFGYDNNGNQTSIAAPLGRDMSQGYDELNRLTQVTDPLSGITHYGYNALDQLISVTDPKGLATAYSYNVLGDLEQQTSPDTGVTVNTYDTGGNLKTSTDARNAIATYTYDALNRVTSAAFAVGSTTDQTLTYSYDAGTYGKGRLTGASDSNHALSWSYDDQGRLLTAGQTVGTVSKTTSYTYSNGQRQSMTTPSGQLITYGYTHGKVTSISVNGTVLASNILYDPFGPVRQWTWGNGTLSVRSFDQDGKLTQIDSAGLKTYGYDDAFRITGITDTTNAALSWTYGYDDLDRLTSASKTGTTLGYSYDANGNRLAQTGSGASTFTVAANSNRLTSTAGALARTYGYDNAGNITSFTGVTFAYDNRGRMKSSTKNAVTTSYLYNALGQRVKKSGSSTTLFVYDDAGHLLGEYIAAGPLIQETVWLGDIPVATLRPKAGGGVDIFYIHTDHLNTPIKISRPSDNRLRWRRDPAPFGAGGVNQNPEGLGIFVYNLMFPGQYSDPESGLFYNYYRDYDPATGRYIEPDPIGLQGGLNTYGYAYQNPIAVIDPLGLEGWYCRRPLGRPPGTRGPPILNHQYLCITRADGTIECGSQTTDGNGISSPGRPTRPDEDYFDKNSCEKVDDDKDRCYERCVLSNFRKPRSRYGIGPQGTDCQEWSDTTNAGCKLLCSKNGRSRERLFPGEK